MKSYSIILDNLRILEGYAGTLNSPDREIFMKKLVFIVVLLIAAYTGWNHFYGPNDSISLADRNDSVFSVAFDERKSGFQTEGNGVVIKILTDDNKGSRHQRFILRLKSGQTLLVAHNIDLAPRISSLREGDVVAFNGVYEWNSKGGVIHWTHHDPSGRHVPGWLQHNGQIYQ